MGNKINFREFNSLSRFQKYALLEDQGIFLDVSRYDGTYQIALFYLFNFYVEVWLCIEADKIEKAAAFTSYKRLDPFLKDIDITTLLI